MKFLSLTPQRRMQCLVVLVAFCLNILIGWLDYLSGWEWSLFAIYSLPIVLVVWKTNGRVGFIFALLSTFVCWLALVGNNPFQSDWAFAWAIFSRLFYFVILSITVTIIKDKREQGLARIKRLEQAQVLEQRILQASEREQQRIGHDLHDSLGPHLASIAYAASFLENDLRKRQQPEASQAEQIRILISDAITLTRDLARGIFPVQLEGEGLSLALEDLVSVRTRKGDIEITYHENGEILIDDPELSIQLYRIAQEALSNATQHAEAKKITISLNHSASSLCLVVTDDGIGIPPLANPRQGMGLYSMRYRARMVGGDFRVDSISGVGTAITCEIFKPFKPIARLAS